MKRLIYIIFIFITLTLALCADAGARTRSNKRAVPPPKAKVEQKKPAEVPPPPHADKSRQARPKTVAEQPDLDAIRAEVLNPRSQYYYPKLMERYEKNETIMNLNDYRHLYYGYLFQEDFNPYRHSEASTKNESLYYKQGHTRAELDSIITYAHEALADNPFNLTQMNFLIYALRARGKVNLASIWQYRLNHLLQAIVSSGTGADKENAWFVIDPRHEYNIINFQNAVARHQEYEEPYYDRIDVEKTGPKGNKESSTYYFNIRNLLEEYYRKFPETDEQ